jgi:hypothetical protein
MTFTFFISQLYYRHFRPEYTSFDGSYNIKDSTTDREVVNEISFLAKNEQHAEKIFKIYKTNHLILMEKKSDFFGLSVKIPDGKRKKALFFAGTLSGTGDIKRNITTGFNTGGISPFKLGEVLRDTLYRAYIRQNQNGNQKFNLSKRRLQALLFVEITLASLILILISIGIYTGHIGLFYGYIGLMAFAVVTLLGFTTAKIIDNQ